MNTGRFITTALAASILAIPAVAEAPGYFKVPGTDTTLKVYGQVQLREAYGFNGNGMNGADSFSGGNEKTKEKGEWNGSWRSYLGVTTTTPSEYGDVVVNIKGRFKNNDGDNGQAILFNMEQGTIAIGGFKAGTDWSLFGYGAWEPNTLFGCTSDENGSWVSVRQLTYIGHPVPGMDLGVSLEGNNPGTSASTSNATRPNISAVAAYSQDWGGVTLALNYQQKKDWTLNGTNDKSGSGLSWFLSGGWNITKNDQITAMILDGGEGYGSGNDGFYADGNDYSFYKSLAYNVSYTHTWNDKFSSAVTVGQVKWNKEDKAVGLPAASDDYKLTEFIVNTTWQMTKTVSLGVEYQHAQNVASNTKPYVDDNGTAQDSNKLDMLRFKLTANFF